MSKPQKTLAAFVQTSLAGPAQPEARWFAAELAKEFKGTAAVLYYGSCLRTNTIAGLILDFYVIVESYREAHGPGASAFFNHLIPPNVYYREKTRGRETLRAKVAVISRADFVKRASGKVLNVSIWARFSQPARLVYARDAGARAAIVAAIANAVATMVGETVPVAAGQSPEAVWVTALGKTYGSEFRSERETKAREIFSLNKDYFTALTPLALAATGGALRSPGSARALWALRTLNGKVVSLMRLVKAVFTFSGGIDYLAWKIERSSGVRIAIKPWQRRHPLIAGLVLFLRLRLKGAFR